MSKPPRRPNVPQPPRESSEAKQMMPEPRDPFPLPEEEAADRREQEAQTWPANQFALTAVVLASLIVVIGILYVLLG